MSEATDRLSQYIKACNSQGAIGRDDEELLSQAIKTRSVAEELRDALAKLEINPSKGRRAALSKAFQSRWNAGKIESLEKKLDRRQNALGMLAIHWSSQ